MKRLLFAAALCFLSPGLVSSANARDHFSIYANVGCCGGYYGAPYYGYGGPAYYSPYYYPYYVAPPPVVYAMPPTSQVVYAPPPTAIAPAPYVEPAVAANQTSPTFIDSAGRTCRHYQSTNGGPAFGTACLQPDGSWRAVQ